MATATITRKFDRWAYPKNGNLNNPTPYFRWEAEVNGQIVTSADRTLASAKAFLAEYFGITDAKIVREQLPRNPYSARYACTCLPEDDGSITDPASNCPIHGDGW